MELNDVLPYLPILCALMCGGSLVVGVPLFILWRMNVARQKVMNGARAIARVASNMHGPDVHVRVELTENVFLRWLNILHIIILVIAVGGGIILLVMYLPAGAAELLLVAISEGIIQLIKVGVKKISGPSEEKAIQHQ